VTVSYQMLSALTGLLLGVANFIGFRIKAAALSEAEPPSANTRRLRLLKILAWFDLIAFPVIGWFIPVAFKGL
jgi:hypothetical protein